MPSQSTMVDTGTGPCSVRVSSTDTTMRVSGHWILVNQPFIYSCILNPELTQEEAYDIFKKCVMEIQKRLIVNLPTFKVAVVDKNGVRYLDEITKESLGSYNPSA